MSPLRGKRAGSLGEGMGRKEIFASQTADYVATTCLQLHGGYGYMREYEVERYFRDLRLNAIGGGTSEILKEIVGRKMGL